MLTKALVGAAINALSGVDKAAALKLAANVISVVSQHRGSPGMQVVADIIAQTAVRSSDPSGHGPAHRAIPPAIEVASENGWRRAMEILATANSSRDASASNSHEAVPAPTMPPVEDAGLHGILAGQYDAINLGPWALNLYQMQLSVANLRAPGNIGGLYWLGELPSGSWVRLQDRGARVLPVWINKDPEKVAVRVGGGPAESPMLAATDARV